MMRDQIAHDARLSGMVARYHTWPTLTQQSTGEHSWQVLRLHILLFGPPEPRVTEYIVFHDSEELAIGDPPFPVKARNPVLKAEYDRLGAVAIKMIIGREMPELNSIEAARVKVCDLLEMFEFGLHEWYMGNRYAEPIIQDTAVAAVLIAKSQLCSLDVGVVNTHIKKRREILR